MSLCGGVNSIIKMIVIILFVLSMICGVILLIMGFKIWNDKTETNQFSTPYLWIFGALALTFSLYGLSAVIHDDDFMMNVYAVASMALAIVQIGVGISFLVKVENENEFSNEVKKQLLELYENKLHMAPLNILVNIHASYKCCGVYGPDGPEVVVEEMMVMGSCCDDGWFEYRCLKSFAYKEGCLSHVIKKAEYRAIFKGIINTISGLIQVVAAALAAFLANFSFK